MKTGLGMLVLGVMSLAAGYNIMLIPVGKIYSASQRSELLLSTIGIGSALLILGILGVGLNLRNTRKV